jgi:hypothetical protein
VASLLHNLFACRRKKVVTIIQEAPAKVAPAEAVA